MRLGGDAWGLVWAAATEHRSSADLKITCVGLSSLPMSLRGTLCWLVLEASCLSVPEAEELVKTFGRKW